jgi:hypothetical protein
MNNATWSKMKKKLSKDMKTVWAGRVISVLVVFPFIMSAMMKFNPTPEVLQGMSHLGLPETLLFRLGIIELLCVIIYLIPQTVILGAILLTGYVGGTIITHLRVEENVFVQVTLGLLIWLGIYLREPRLREILPLIKLKKK